MKYFFNILFCLILIAIGAFLGFYIYSSLNAYEKINYELFSLDLKEGKVTSVEINNDKIIVVTMLTDGKKQKLEYNILPISDKKRVMEAIKDKPDMLVEETSSLKNYLFILPFILLFLVLSAIIIAARRGNIKQTLFREKKFNLNSPLQKARLSSITWINIMSGESFKIIVSYGDLSSSEQDTYLLLLLEAIHSEDLEIRRKASFALREIGDSRTVLPLCKMLEEDEDEHVRMNASLTLGILRDERAIKSLKKAMKDQNPLVRCSVATALGSIGDEESLEVLTKMLSEDDNWRARRSAVIALMKLRNDKALSKLITALKDEEPMVRSSAAIALGEMGVEEAIPELGKILLEDPEASVRRDVIGALQTIGENGIIKPLCQALLEDENLQVRLSAVNAMELIEDDMVTNTLCTVLTKDKDSYVRLAAAEALSWRNNPSVMDAMKIALDDEDEMVQDFAREIMNGAE